jgi:release factor glutamine methyltransferase
VEAEILLMHVTGSSRASLLTHPERPLQAAEAQQYEQLVGARVLGYPLPYLTGKTEFYGLEIEVTPDVMIPRPDTEVLVDLALQRRPVTIVDVCTGSGCIAIALVAHLPEASCLGIDISPAALAVARRNAEKHGIEARIQFIIGDLLDRRPGPVDLIIANPPYVSADEWASLPKSTLYHEPYQALNGGPDGLEVIRRLLSQSQGLLRPGGTLLLEIGASQGEVAMEMAKTSFPDGGTTVRIHPDLAGRDRVLEVRT